jgi:hypothetical protein
VTATVSGYCRRGECGPCVTYTAGRLLTGTDPNRWCTHTCHPEPALTDEKHRPALEFWRQHRPDVAS